MSDLPDVGTYWTEGVEAAMKAMGCAKSLAPFTVGDDETWDCFRHGNYWTDEGCPHAVAVAAAVVAALRLPERDREAAAKALDEAADADDWDSALGRANVRVRLRSRASALRERRD